MAAVETVAIEAGAKVAVAVAADKAAVAVRAEAAADKAAVAAVQIVVNADPHRLVPDGFEPPGLLLCGDPTH